MAGQSKFVETIMFTLIPSANSSSALADCERKINTKLQLFWVTQHHMLIVTL